MSPARRKQPTPDETNGERDRFVPIEGVPGVTDEEIRLVSISTEANNPLGPEVVGSGNVFAVFMASLIASGAADLNEVNIPGIRLEHHGMCRVRRSYQPVRCEPGRSDNHRGHWRRRQRELRGVRSKGAAEIVTTRLFEPGGAA